jgi:Flp pilus assembly pilin Flp
MARRPTSHVSALLGRLTENQRGVTGVEYTMIAATISVAAIVGMNAVGEALLGAIGNWMS